VEAHQKEIVATLRFCVYEGLEETLPELKMPELKMPGVKMPEATMPEVRLHGLHRP
jgi:hypothetical protein